MNDCQTALALLCLLPMAPLTAQVPEESEPASDEVAALLFTYDVLPGTREQFELGYQRHLEWHRKAGDPWIWFGWYVTTGESLGRFVDGSFGLQFDALDARVSPVEDRMDAEVNVAPFVKPVARTVYRRRPDLGTGSLLERGETAPHLDVMTYLVRPGHEAAFEKAVRESVAHRSGEGPSDAWYELVVGGPMPTYMRLVPRGHLADLQEVASHSLGGKAVERIWSETWSYQERLSYFPKPQ